MKLTKLPKKTDDSTSVDPTEEYPYTWIDVSKNDYGFFHKTVDGALREANNNFMQFDTLKRDVLIVKAIGWANKTED